MSEFISAFGAIFLLLFLSIYIIVKVAQRVTIFEYERGIKFRKGKFIKVLEPGVYWQFGRVKIEKVDIRKRYEIVPGQEILTSDGASVKLSLIAAYEVVDLKKAIVDTKDYQSSLYLMLQAIARSEVGKLDIESFLKDRDNFIKEIGKQAENKALEIGLKVSEVAVRDIMLAGELKKAVSQVATARQEGLAKLERARGESAALRNLANAAKMIEDNPNLLKLRTLDAISQGSGNTVILGSSEIMPIVKK